MSYFDVETAQPLPASPNLHSHAMCVSGAFEMHLLPLNDLITKGFIPCSTIYCTPDGDPRPGNDPVPISGVRFDLVGIDPVILASDHERGLTPIVTIFTSDDDIVSFPINIAANGDVTVDTKADVTGLGFVAVLR